MEKPESLHENPAENLKNPAENSDKKFHYELKYSSLTPKRALQKLRKLVEEAKSKGVMEIESIFTVLRRYIAMFAQTHDVIAEAVCRHAKVDRIEDVFSSDELFSREKEKDDSFFLDYLYLCQFGIFSVKYVYLHSIRVLGSYPICDDIEESFNRKNFAEALAPIDDFLANRAAAKQKPESSAIDDDLIRKIVETMQKAMLGAEVAPVTTQEQRATWFGVDVRTIRNWDTGKTSAPSTYDINADQAMLEGMGKIYQAGKATRKKVRLINRFDARDQDEPPEFENELDRAAWNEERNRKKTGNEPEK
ncbi:MAG: hypothetical protein LBU64_04455 [Planctomycetota bacterium]|jgi:hypothetical protein|nr:hypothetical protein [Planctomycetota bacterium]